MLSGNLTKWNPDYLFMHLVVKTYQKQLVCHFEQSKARNTLHLNMAVHTYSQLK